MGGAPVSVPRSPVAVLADSPGALLARTFRANPDYQLVRVAELPRSERSSLGGAAHDPRLHGVLRPAVPGLMLKAVDADAAALVTSLARPRSLVHLADDPHAPMLARRIAALVLDHVLEVELDGRFVRGAAAHATMLAPSDDDAPPHIIASLSRQALRLGAALPIADPIALSRRLYRFNGCPITSAWRRRFPDADAIARWLGIGVRAGTPYTWRGAGWERIAAVGGAATWAAWDRRARVAGASRDYPRHKLYVSARADVLRDLLDAIVPVLGSSRAVHFKVGCTLGAVMRADKLVIYFGDADALDDAVAPLRDALRPFVAAAQGTPFTRSLDDSGILSSGFDPPPGPHHVPWRGRESWRLWVTNRLATYLLAARVYDTHDVAESDSPWRFARDRIALDGVDPLDWTPADDSAPAFAAPRTS